VDPVPDPPLLRKSGSTGNRTLTSGSVAWKSDHYTTEAFSLDPKGNETETPSAVQNLASCYTD
jgi:hypothetical protein